MKTAIALLFALCAFPLAAQPAKDLDDAEALVRAQERDMTPVFAQMREMAAALDAMAKAQHALTDAQPATALDQAVKALDEYTDAAGRRGVMLGRDFTAIIAGARRFLDGFRNGAPIPDVTAIREKFHHNYVHPIQRRVALAAMKANSIAASYEGLARRMHEMASGTLGPIVNAATDPEKP